MRSKVIAAIALALSCVSMAADMSSKTHLVDPPTTYCNPMNLDYAFAPDRAYSHNNAHRSTADPVCIMYKGLYYLFSTNQEGYWWSKDMASWHFISHFFKENASRDQVCAPAAWPTKQGILFLPCFVDADIMPLYLSKDPISGSWKEAVESYPVPSTWDPSLFEDDDGRMYAYWGSSNFYPMYAVELDQKNGYQPIGKKIETLRLDPKKHGWEQFGENNQNGTMDPFIEGSWMNKFNGKYYLQYGAPGTEYNVYGDGVYVADHPLGPFKYQEHNPFSWKPGGFIRGAGHGSTFNDSYGNLWHIATMVISVKQTFERRLGLFPAGVDKDGVLFADTSFGDYPQYLPKHQRDPHSTFTGWMLLSYKKKAWASSSKHDTALAFDEDIKTYWSATDGKPGQFLAVDLGKQMDVNAIQINYADEDANLFGKQHGIHHRYQIFDSDDGKTWNLLIDKSKNKFDVPHDYLELSAPVKTRYLKIVNIEMPTGCFAIGDFRVFGKASGEAPAKVSGFKIDRDEKDRRNLALKWDSVPGAYAYEISFGVSPDKMYSSILVNGNTKYDLHSLNVDSPYYFHVQSVGESGVSTPSELCSVK
ncbi:MAG: family 43 glycosylhydrolase [Candidatus Obscuribacterales bacterium]|nr:family 43 glycosylhydrolase [Candidatus Obscuribacterales bacterium]